MQCTSHTFTHLDAFIYRVKNVYDIQLFLSPVRARSQVPQKSLPTKIFGNNRVKKLGKSNVYEIFVEFRKHLFASHNIYEFTRDIPFTYNLRNSVHIFVVAKKTTNSVSAPEFRPLRVFLRNYEANFTKTELYELVIEFLS